MKNILLIEDSLDVIETILQNFSNLFNFHVFHNYSEVQIDLNNVDLILLDINLKNNQNGLIFAEQLKKSDYKHIPILTISGNNQTDEIIHALKIGVNDYICKPLNMHYLFHKMNNFLALIEPHKVFETLNKIEDFEFDESSRIIKYNGKIIDLTKKEYDIFVLLLNHFNKPVPRDKILQKINKGTTTTHRVVDTHILNIRKKLPEGYKIVFANRVGYCIQKNQIGFKIESSKDSTSP